jgi:tetrapyrrole methylase family protein / MazG family protein
MCSPLLLANHGVKMGITVIGLGPGGSQYLTREAWNVLSSAGDVYLRTAHHPAVSDLPGSPRIHSFDHIYQSAPDFAAVYSGIVDELLHKGKDSEIVYGVPGHPHVGESTVTRLLQEAPDHGITIRIVPGMSFVEPVLTALNKDALDGMQIFDALAIAEYLYPPLQADLPLLVGQVYNRFIAGELKTALGAVFPDEHPVFLVHAAGEPNELVESLALYQIDRSESISYLTSLFVPPFPAASSLPALAETVAVLRSPEGCPWDQEQTPKSMRGGFLEEAYEVIAAIDRDDRQNLREELGDLLYHIVMQSQMAAEEGQFTLADVIAGIEAKLRYRHPHVWGDWEVDSTEEVLQNWELLKRQEKDNKGQNSVLDDLLATLPALPFSQKLQGRAAGVGFDWPNVSGVFDKVQEEIVELRAAQSVDELEAELGDLLLVMVNLARHLEVDAESALRSANRRFEERFRLVEQWVSEKGLDFKEMTLDQMNDLWEEAKNSLAKAGGQD